MLRTGGFQPSRSFSGPSLQHSATEASQPSPAAATSSGWRGGHVRLPSLEPTVEMAPPMAGPAPRGQRRAGAEGATWRSRSLSGWSTNYSSMSSSFNPMGPAERAALNRGSTLGPLSLVSRSPEKTYKRAIMASKRLRVETSESDLERQWEFERKARSVMLPRVVPAATPSRGQEQQAGRHQERHRILDLSSMQRQSARLASKARSEPALGAGNGAMTPSARSMGPGPGGSPTSAATDRGFLPGYFNQASPPSQPGKGPTNTSASSLPAELEEEEEVEESPAEQLWAAQLRRERFGRSQLLFDGGRPSDAVPQPIQMKLWLPDNAVAEDSSSEKASNADEESPGFSEVQQDETTPARKPVMLRFEVEDPISPVVSSIAPKVLLFEPPPTDLERLPSFQLDALPPEDPRPGTALPPEPTSPAAPAAPGPALPTPPTPASPLLPALAPEDAERELGDWAPRGGLEGEAEFPEPGEAQGAEGGAELDEPEEAEGRDACRPCLKSATKSFASALAKQEPGATAVPDLVARLKRAEAAYLDSSNVADVDEESLRSAFKKFQTPHSVEIAKEELHDVMKSLGLGILEADVSRNAADSITPYNELDFDEFLRFAGLYFKEERDRLESSFLQYDMEKTGSISVDSLRKLMAVIGITPMHGMTLEALAMIGLDKKSLFDFEAFICFVVVYRHSEGFARSEVERLHKAFVRFVHDDGSESGSENTDLDTSDLLLSLPQVGTLLVAVFGLQVQEEANKLQKKIDGLSGNGGANKEEVSFREFLTFARWLREAELERVRKEFTRHTDNTGSIRVEELPSMLKDLGYEPLQPVISDIAKEVETMDPGRLNVEEFFQFLLIFQSRDGFLAAELEEMQQVFMRFDEDGSETIDVPELGTMLRHMGYYLCLDDIHLLVKEVDVNHRGSLDYHEFRRLMRLHRDREVRRYRAIFERYTQGQEKKTALLAKDDISAALEDTLGHLKAEVGDEAENNAARPELPEQAVDFEAFYALAEKNRSNVVATLRRFAGFSREMVQLFQELFKKWDADESGVIDPNEIEGLLKELGMECRTVEEQRSLIAQLDAARAAAIEAGVEPECRPGEGAICFWVLVQLMRLLKNEREKSAEDREAEVVKELDFSKAEVEDFREVFLRWTRHGGNATTEEGQADGHCASVQGGFGAHTANDEEGLSKATFSKLLLSLGVTLTKKEREELEEKFSEAEVDYHGHLSFLGFLGLMRWLLDSDFAGVNDAAQQTISAAVQKRRASMASLVAGQLPAPPS